MLSIDLATQESSGPFDSIKKVDVSIAIERYATDGVVPAR
jgi:hypothetical protein